MPLAKRIVPCLDVDHGKVVKGINFLNPKTQATPSRWQNATATKEQTNSFSSTSPPPMRNATSCANTWKASLKPSAYPSLSAVEYAACQTHRNVLCSGADKVSVNTAAVENPKVNN